MTNCYKTGPPLASPPPLAYNKGYITQLPKEAFP